MNLTSDFHSPLTHLFEGVEVALVGVLVHAGGARAVVPQPHKGKLAHVLVSPPDGEAAVIGLNTYMNSF